MSDFSHVKPGDKKIKARSFNTMMDAARFFQVFQKKWGVNPVQLQASGVRVKITGAASGGGKYDGRILTHGDAVAPTGNLIEADLGVVPTATDCLILYPPEVGTSSHSLTSADNTVDYFVGTYGAPCTDGRPTVIIAGVGLKVCP